MSNHICYSVSEHCRNLIDSYGEICVGCNACGRINPKTMLDCWLAVEKSYLDADFCKITPDLDENQVRNVQSNIKSIGKKIKEIEQLIAERDKAQ